MYVTIRKRTEKSQQALGGRFQVREVTAGSGGTGAWHHMQGHGRKTTATAVAVTAEGMWCHPALGTTCGFTAGRRPSRQQRSRQQGSRQRGLITPASALSAVGVTAACVTADILLKNIDFCDPGQPGATWNEKVTIFN